MQCMQYLCTRPIYRFGAGVLAAGTRNNVTAATMTRIKNKSKHNVMLQVIQLYILQRYIAAHCTESIWDGADGIECETVKLTQ